MCVEEVGHELQVPWRVLKKVLLADVHFAWESLLGRRPRKPPVKDVLCDVAHEPCGCAVQL